MSENGWNWLNRDCPEYDPNRIGAVTQAKVIAALIAAGKVVLAPCVDVRPYDLVVEENDLFYRVQCKTGRIVRGAVYFRSHRLRAARRETGWQRVVTTYEGKIDYFGVYCPENDQVYLVPIGVVAGQQVFTLRLTPAKNNQRSRVHWASEYLLRPKPLSRPLPETVLGP